jgi:hypothetical protein
MYLQLAEGENNGNYGALAEAGGVMDNYVFVPAGFLPEFNQDTYVRADYFNKYDPTTAEALINALISQQTVGLSVIGVAAIASGGLKLAKGLLDKRKAAVAAGTAKPLFKPGGLFDKVKGAINKNAPQMQQKAITLPDQPVGGSVQLPGGQFNIGFNPSEQQQEQPSFWAKNKTAILIGGGILAAGGIYLLTRKKKR